MNAIKESLDTAKQSSLSLSKSCVLELVTLDHEDAVRVLFALELSLETNVNAQFGVLDGSRNNRLPDSELLGRLASCRQLDVQVHVLRLNLCVKIFPEEVTV